MPFAGAFVPCGNNPWQKRRGLVLTYSTEQQQPTAANSSGGRVANFGLRPLFYVQVYPLSPQNENTSSAQALYHSLTWGYAVTVLL